MSDRCLNQWVTHDETVWQLWARRTWLMRLVGAPTEYRLVRDNTLVGLFEYEAEALDHLRDALAASGVQVPWRLLPVAHQNYLLATALGDLTYDKAMQNDLVKYGWLYWTKAGTLKRRTEQ